MIPADFNYLATLLKQRSGLALTHDKEYLLETRLQPIARRCGASDLTAFTNHLRRNAHDEALLREVIEAMTTNESMFFRDLKPFDQLREVVIPRLREKKPGRKTRFWSAACSNGQEPYSIVMTLLENRFMPSAAGVEILATDLDTQVLAKAQQARYTQFEVQRGMPIAMLVKYFTQADANQWQVKDEVKKHVTFRPHNLLLPCAAFGKFDVIMCRNVLIYFDEETKKGVLSRLAEALEPGGLLFLGSAESVVSLCDRLRPVADQRGMFELKA